MAEQLSRGEVQDLLTKFSKKNPNYRAALLKNPKAVVEGQMGTKIPANILRTAPFRPLPPRWFTCR